MRKHSIGMGVKTGFSNVMTTQVRRARDDLSDLATVMRIREALATPLNATEDPTAG